MEKHRWSVYKAIINGRKRWIAHETLGLYYELDSWHDAYSLAYIGDLIKWEQKTGKKLVHL